MASWARLGRYRHSQSLDINSDERSILWVELTASQDEHTWAGTDTATCLTCTQTYLSSKKWLVIGVPGCLRGKAMQGGECQHLDLQLGQVTLSLAA